MSIHAALIYLTLIYPSHAARHQNGMEQSSQYSTVQCMHSDICHFHFKLYVVCSTLQYLGIHVMSLHFEVYQSLQTSYVNYLSKLVGYVEPRNQPDF